jgi:GNAT superfamily N-acetyltransferase
MHASGLVVPLRDGRRVVIRPATPDDAEGVRAFVRELSPHSRYQRFLVALRELPEPMVQRIVSGPREEYAALVAAPIGCDVARVVGLSELGRGPGGEDREIAVAVAEDWRRAGLARTLVRALADEARCRGWPGAYADIRRDNLPALRLAHGLGAQFQGSPYGPTLTRITLQAAALPYRSASLAARAHLA